MSGSGEVLGGIAGALVAGAIIIPIAVGGLMIAGAVKATTGLVKLGIAAHEAHVQHRIDSAYARSGRSLGRIASLQSSLGDRFAQCATTLSDSYSNNLDELKAAYDNEHDLTAFVNSYESARRSFAEAYEADLNRIEQEFRIPMSNEMASVYRAVAAEKDEMFRLINEMKDDIAARRETSRNTAEKIISEAHAIVKEFTESHPGNKHAQDYAAVLNEALNVADKRFADGDYEASLIDGYDVYSKCLGTVQTLLAEDMKNDVLYDRLVAVIEEIESNIAATQTIDYEFKDTASGEPKRMPQLDLNPFFRGSRKLLVEKLEQIKATVNRTDRYGFIPEELIDLLHDAEELNITNVKDTALAFDRLYNYCERMELADIIAETYREEGFYEEDPQEDVDALDSICVYLVNDETGEQVKIFLDADIGENYRIYTGIDIYNHADDLSNPRAVEQRRDELRQNICDAVNELYDLDADSQQSLTGSCDISTVGKNSF